MKQKLELFIFFYSSCNDNEPKYPSLAQFVEGNDIARKSFKRPNLKSASTKQKQSSKEQENNVTDLVHVQIQGSHSDISEAVTVKDATIMKTPKTSNNENKYGKEMSEKDEIKAKKKIPHISFVIDPPSPSISDELKTSKFYENRRHSSHTPSLLAPKDVEINRRHSGNNPSLLGLDNERVRFLSCSPAATRRISVGSLFKSSNLAKLGNIKSGLTSEAKLCTTDKENEENEKKKMRKRDSTDFVINKKLPIINPLVRLPTWPSKFLF